MSDVAAVTEIESTYRAGDGCALHAYEWSSRDVLARPAPLVVIMHGYAEHCGRYRELARVLVRAGHWVGGFDARGHGKSPGQRGHIDRFDSYIDDLHGFMEAVQRRFPGRPLILLGHSNGGLTALRLVQSRRHVADGLVLCSPLVALQKAHRPVPRWVAVALTSVAARLPFPNGLHARELTRDVAVLEAHRRDGLGHDWTTASWYAAATGAMQWAFASLDTVRLPVLVLVAECDPIVVPGAVVKLFEGMASPDKELVRVPGALHEIFNELGREETYRQVVRWLGERWSAELAA